MLVKWIKDLDINKSIKDHWRKAYGECLNVHDVTDDFCNHIAAEGIDTLRPTCIFFNDFEYAFIIGQSGRISLWRTKSDIDGRFLGNIKYWETPINITHARASLVESMQDILRTHTQWRFSDPTLHKILDASWEMFKNSAVEEETHPTGDRDEIVPGSPKDDMCRLIGKPRDGENLLVFTDMAAATYFIKRCSPPPMSTPTLAIWLEPLVGKDGEEKYALVIRPGKDAELWRKWKVYKALSCKLSWADKPHRFRVDALESVLRGYTQRSNNIVNYADLQILVDYFNLSWDPVRTLEEAEIEYIHLSLKSQQHGREIKVSTATPKIETGELRRGDGAQSSRSKFTVTIGRLSHREVTGSG